MKKTNIESQGEKIKNLTIFCEYLAKENEKQAREINELNQNIERLKLALNNLKEAKGEPDHHNQYESLATWPVRDHEIDIEGWMLRTKRIVDVNLKFRGIPYKEFKDSHVKDLLSYQPVTQYKKPPIKYPDPRLH